MGVCWAPLKTSCKYSYLRSYDPPTRLQICPLLYIFGNYPPQMVPTTDLNIGDSPGFGGLMNWANGQIYPEVVGSLESQL